MVLGTILKDQLVLLTVQLEPMEDHLIIHAKVALMDVEHALDHQYKNAIHVCSTLEYSTS